MPWIFKMYFAVVATMIVGGFRESTKAQQFGLFLSLT